MARRFRSDRTIENDRVKVHPSSFWPKHPHCAVQAYNTRVLVLQTSEARRFDHLWEPWEGYICHLYNSSVFYIAKDLQKGISYPSQILCTVHATCCIFNHEEKDLSLSQRFTITVLYAFTGSIFTLIYAVSKQYHLRMHLHHWLSSQLASNHPISLRLSTRKVD